jgi:ribose transport system permease protein/putative xylitol transport system permease protein
MIQKKLMTRPKLSLEWLRSIMTNVGPFIFVIAVVAIFQLINPFFLSYQGIITLIYAMSYFLIAACGLTFVILTGSFDFSVPSVLRLSALICVMYIEKIGLLVIPMALVACLVIGFVNGLLLAKFKVPSFLATLGISIVLEGIAWYLTKGHLALMQNETFRSLATFFIAGFPSTLYWGMGVWIICTFVALVTPFGRRTYAVGGNLEGAGLSDINVARHRIYVFMLSGFLSGLAGILYMSQMGGGSVRIGADMAIPLFASVVAGGTALTGGVGGPHRTLLGVIIITWIQAGMAMLAIGSDIQMITFGLIAIGMSIATIDRKRIKIVK